MSNDQREKLATANLELQYEKEVADEANGETDLLPDKATHQEQQIDTNTLDLVFAEAKDAYSRLMSDVDTFHSKADQQTQISLIIMGIYLTFGAGIIASGLGMLATPLFLSTIALTISVSLCVFVRARGAFFAGTIYPHILSARLTEKSEQIKRELLNTLSSSYYYNLATLINKRRWLTVAVYFQIAGIFLPVVAVLIQVIVLVIRG